MGRGLVVDMDTRGRSLSLEFGNPCHAVQLRITPQLKDALLNANLAGESIQMRLDEGTGVSNRAHTICLECSLPAVSRRGSVNGSKLESTDVIVFRHNRRS